MSATVIFQFFQLLGVIVAIETSSISLADCFEIASQKGQMKGWKLE